MSGDLARLLADIVAADGAHPLDDGLCAQLDRDGYTAAGKRRLAEMWRDMAAAQPDPEPPP